MRIALLAPFGLQPKGTVSARMMPLAHALARRGHMVRVVIPPWDDPSATPGSDVSPLLADTGETAGVHVVTLPLPRLPYSPAFTYGLVREALRPSSRVQSTSGHTREQAATEALATFRAEVAHVFKPVGYSGLAGLALSALRVPWVLDTDDWEGPGGWADVNPYSRTQKLAMALQEAALPRLAGAVTAASRTLEGRAWTFGLPRRKVFYMPNGVSRDRYDAWLDAAHEAKARDLRGKYGLGEAPVLLLYTRFAEFPYTWALDVLERVRGEHSEARLLMVGSGFFGEEDRLQKEAGRRGLSDAVIVTGRVAEAEVPAYLRVGDVALYPMEDTLLNRAKSPVKVLEPMLVGVPLVAHEVGQAAEFIGDAGLLIPPGDLEGMAAGASALLGDAGLRRALGEAAQRRVWTQFDWSRLSALAEGAYQFALSRRVG